MRRVVRSKSHRRKPSVIQGHSWTLEEIRERPEEAYKLFDARGDGQVTVAELCFTARKTSSEHRRRGSIFDEMKLFQVLDIDGDAIVSLKEFCEVVRDPQQFSNEALMAIANMATRKEEEKQANSAKKSKEDTDADDLEAAAATMGLIQGISLRRSQRIMPPPSPTSSRIANIDDSYQCALHLVAINVAPAALLENDTSRSAWYENLFSFNQKSSTRTASPYIAVIGRVRTEDIVLARTNIVKDTLAATFDQVLIPHQVLAKLDTPYHVFLKIFDAAHQKNSEEKQNAEDLNLGTTLVLDLLPPKVDPLLEVALGPFSALDASDDVTAKLLGTRIWLKHTDDELDNLGSNAQLDNFFACQDTACVSSSFCVFTQSNEISARNIPENDSQPDQRDTADMRAIAAARLSPPRNAPPHENF